MLRGLFFFFFWRSDMTGSMVRIRTTFAIYESFKKVACWMNSIILFVCIKKCSRKGYYIPRAFVDRPCCHQSTQRMQSQYVSPAQAIGRFNEITTQILSYTRLYWFEKMPNLALANSSLWIRGPHECMLACHTCRKCWSKDYPNNSPLADRSIVTG
jgi:hypothetical protein